MIGVHTVTAYPDATLTGGVDLTCLIDALTINHGRDDTGSQPDASSVTIDLTTDVDPLPPVVEIGAYLKVTTRTVATYTRFLGRITDIALGWEEAGELTPYNGVGKVTAVSPLADLGRKVVGDAPFPQELDGARVSRVLALAGITLNPATSDPGTVQILPRDIDSQPALDVAQGTAFSGAGVLWETAAGEIRYSDANHRKGTPSALTLDACDLFVTPTWRRTLEGLVNEVSIGYGVAPEGGEQPRYTATNEVSKGRYGRYGYSTTTELAAAADAAALGQLLLVRNASPVWIMAALPVDTAGLDDARYDALLGLEVHSLITLTGLPSIGTAPSPAVSLWVEGWKETLEFGAHAIELVVSGYCRTVPAPQWDNIDPAWVWGGVTWAEQRRNRCRNPKVGNDVTDWTTATGTGGVASAARMTDANIVTPSGQVITTYYRSTWSTASTSISSTGPVVGAPTVDALPVVGGQPLALSAYFRTSRVGGGAVANLVATFHDAGGATVGTTVSGPPVANDAVTFQKLTLLTTPPATAVRTYVRTYQSGGAAWKVGDTTDQTGFMCEQATTAGAYLDGDGPDSPNAWDYAWVGPPNASQSTYSIAAAIIPGLDPSWRWDDMSCLGPPTNYGRWNDQPASMRWDTVNAANTWDTFTGQ